MPCESRARREPRGTGGETNYCVDTAQWSLRMAAAPAVLRLHPHKGPRGGSAQLQLVQPTGS